MTEEELDGILENIGDADSDFYYDIFFTEKKDKYTNIYCSTEFQSKKAFWSRKKAPEKFRSLENMRFFISLRTEVHDGRL